MSKYTVSKSRTTQEWAKQLEAKTFTIRERVYYENGIEVKSVKNIELDNNHKIRGYSDPFKQAIHNY